VNQPPFERQSDNGAVTALVYKLDTLVKLLIKDNIQIKKNIYNRCHGYFQHISSFPSYNLCNSLDIRKNNMYY